MIKFKRGDLVTSIDRPFERIIIVTQSVESTTSCFIGTLIKMTEFSEYRNINLGENHTGWKTTKFFKIEDMEITLKIKTDVSEG